jgi:3D (Asp-Asp-Asp) domain-containing protein/peptidoglycan hydrolase CwlO-like protein
VFGPHKVRLLGSRAVRWRRESRLALGLTLACALVLGASLPGAEGAGNDAGKLREAQKSLTVRSHSALLSLYALDARLAQARTELSRLRARAAALRVQQRQIEEEIGVVEGNVVASQRLLGDHLRTLYQHGEPDALAVLLGARSLDDAATGLDALEQTTRQSKQAVVDSRAGRAKLEGLASELAARVREVQVLQTQAGKTATALSSARAQRVAYIASLARQRRLTARQIAALDSHARRVVEQTQAVQAQSGFPIPAAATPIAGGAHTLTVTATGYSLPGRTATGLPVGFGVVAVDPSVIPLGTRMTIPGYGEGVAADTGSAVQGYTIDLWFPTLADALAWGRRTVTITLH